MNRSELEKGTEENGEVAELLATLPRVEAPANFDFGVRARIAGGGSDRRSQLFSLWKAAVPLSLVLLIGAFVFYYATLPGDDNTIAVAGAEQNYAPGAIPITNPVVSPSERNTNSENVGPRVTPSLENRSLTESTRKPNTVAPRRSRNSASTSEGGGSKDLGLTDVTRNVIQPRGTNPNKNSDVSIRELLEMLGMKVDPASGKWTVLSISANSVAERSGVLANDVIDTIDDQAIGGKEKLKGSGGRSVTVSRGGKSIRLDLKR